MEEGIIKTAPDREKAKSILKMEFKVHDITLIDDLRIIRNKISYNGFFVTDEVMICGERRHKRQSTKK